MKAAVAGSTGGRRRLDAVGDDRPEARLVGIASARDLVAPVRSSERHSWTNTLARSMSSVTTPTWARTSAIELDAGPDVDRRDRPPRARVGRGLEPVRRRSTIDHRTSCLEVTWAYRLAPWMSTARAMSRTLVPAVAMRVEEGAGGVLDLLAAGRLDHAGLLTNDR